MTSISYIVHYQGDLKVSVPNKTARDHVYVNDEKFTVHGSTLRIRGYDAYTVDENMVLSKGKHHNAWQAYVNEPICYETWRSMASDSRVPNPRNIIVSGETYQVELLSALWPRPLLKKNGKVVAKVRDGEIIWVDSGRTATRALREP